MKQSFIILFVLFISLSCFGTDLLIVGKDTFYLKTYPLEALNLMQRPFGLDKLDVQVSNQFPGYQAVWKIIGGKLYLEKIISASGDDRQEENITELFKKNAVPYQADGEMIFADWFSITYYPMEPYSAGKRDVVFLAGSFDETFDANKALVRFEKGQVKINKLPQDNR